ncbi:hypothetical protein F8388_020665 [Cannabis sativa]|uniref:Uncharacterized protein n=2 Tax=Cannabis sativa TaxID=3483 RepID=A0A7J6F5F9_CANSA|nr:hypothetical protein F8388_020664 [Cannabis sativa]KAF4364951.1 hypothetical protein F8388_020665 [Cannabis sativa]
MDRTQRDRGKNKLIRVFGVDIWKEEEHKHGNFSLHESSVDSRGIKILTNEDKEPKKLLQEMDRTQRDRDGGTKLFGVDIWKEEEHKPFNVKGWKKDEHIRFLRGLQEVGRGRWKLISESYVKTRTPSQVASHAQKFINKHYIKHGYFSLHESSVDSGGMKILTNVDKEPKKLLQEVMLTCLALLDCAGLPLSEASPVFIITS